MLQLDLKYMRKVNFYPGDNNFTQALLVMLVTNMISGSHGGLELEQPEYFGKSFIDFFLLAFPQFHGK